MQGDAVFWYNLHHDGSGDFDTRHAACPVLIGEKWGKGLLHVSFTFIDFHAPTNLLFWFPLTMFMWLFETETAWQLLKTDLLKKLDRAGFQFLNRSFHAGGSLQVIQVIKP